MRYSIRHVTRFTYESPITESVMETRMQPRTDNTQRCLQFTLHTSPSARVMEYRDHDHNVVHHFNIPGRHSRLTVTAEALVECLSTRSLPHRLGPAAWSRLDAMTVEGLVETLHHRSGLLIHQLGRILSGNKSLDRSKFTCIGAHSLQNWLYKSI